MNESFNLGLYRILRTETAEAFRFILLLLLWKARYYLGEKARIVKLCVYRVVSAMLFFGAYVFPLLTMNEAIVVESVYLVVEKLAKRKLQT